MLPGYLLKNIALQDRVLTECSKKLEAFLTAGKGDPKAVLAEAATFKDKVATMIENVEMQVMAATQACAGA